MARVYAALRRLPYRCLLHTSSGNPSNPPPHQEMDFMKAAQILFSEDRRQKKFGLDFHLWQLFVACLPSFAIYLTAQYARREMKRMEEEKELKEREKVKSLIGETSNMTEPSVQSPKSLSNPPSSEGKTEDKQAADLQILKSRLDAVEEKVREIEFTKVNDNSGTVKDKQLRKGVVEKLEDNVKPQESGLKTAQTVHDREGTEAGLNSGSKAPQIVIDKDLKKEDDKEHNQGNQEKKGGS